MLVKRSLWGHSIVVGLAIHSLAATESTVTSLAVVAKLVHVAGIVRVVVVGVVIWVAASVLTGLRLSMWLVHMLALRSRSSRMLTAQCRVRGGMPAVLSLVVTALALFAFVRDISLSV